MRIKRYYVEKIMSYIIDAAKRDNYTMGTGASIVTVSLWNYIIQQVLPWELLLLIIMKLYLAVIVILHAVKAAEVSSQVHKAELTASTHRSRHCPHLYMNIHHQCSLNYFYLNTITALDEHHDLEKQTRTRSFISETEIIFSSFKIKYMLHNTHTKAKYTPLFVH